MILLKVISTIALEKYQIHLAFNEGTSVSLFLGIVINFFFQEYNPPHFHALYGEFEADIIYKICLLMLAMMMKIISPSILYNANF